MHPAEPASGCDDVAAGRPGCVLGGPARAVPGRAGCGARTSQELGAEETGLLQHPADEPAPAWLGVLVAAYKAKQSEVVMRVGASSAAAAMTAAAPAVVAGAPPPAPAARIESSELFELFNVQSGGAGLGERERPQEGGGRAAGLRRGEEEPAEPALLAGDAQGGWCAGGRTHAGGAPAARGRDRVQRRGCWP